MNERSATERLTEALVRANAHWETGRDKPRQGMTIAVSREVGAPGSSLARELGRRLDWPVYDHELLELIGREMNVRTQLLESVDERHKSWLQERVESFSAVPYVSENAFVLRVIETVLSLGTHGECIIVGRGAAHVLPPSTTLRVRLIATLDDRVERMRLQWNLPRDEAQRKLENDDRERARFIKNHFHIDAADPARYDLVLNASRCAVPECAAIVIAALHQLERKADSLLPAARS